MSLTETPTPVVLVPPGPAEQISITDCGIWMPCAASSAWQFVVDRPRAWLLPTVAGSWMVTGPRLAATGARVSTRLFRIVTCSE
jgi:hypothetical protein